MSLASSPDRPVAACVMRVCWCVSKSSILKFKSLELCKFYSRLLGLQKDRILRQNWAWCLTTENNIFIRHNFISCYLKWASQYWQMIVGAELVWSKNVCGWRQSSNMSATATCLQIQWRRSEFTWTNALVLSKLSSVLCIIHIKASEFARIILRYFLQLQRYPALIHFVLFLSLIATSLVLLQQLSIMCSLQACNNVTECLF